MYEDKGFEKNYRSGPRQRSTIMDNGCLRGLCILAVSIKFEAVFVRK